MGNNGVVIQAQVGSNTYIYEEDIANYFGRDHDANAKLVLVKLDEGYRRIRGAITAGMKPDTKEGKVNPDAESRTVESGSISMKPTKDFKRMVRNAIDDDRREDRPLRH